MSFNIVSHPNPDKLGLAKATGKHDFSTDRTFPGLLYTAYLGSPYPHAKITAIDTTAASALTGVMAITTYQDCPVFTQELFYVGQEVAAIAATDLHIAQQAVQLLKVTYQVLPYVTDLDKAITNQTLTGLLPNTNEVGQPVTSSWGNVATGFASADVVVEDTIGMTASFQHSLLEPRSCIAIWDYSVQDQVTIYTNSQNPFGQRAAIAGALNVPLNNVTVISHGSGGGFGDLHFAEWCVVAAVLAKKAGAPVQNHLSRHDNYLTATQQYPDRGDVKLGAKKDGTLVAAQGTFWTDIGAFPWPGVGDAISPLNLTFNVPNMSITGHTITTNKPRCGYWRTVGEPGGIFILDGVIEQLCAKLGMDPLQFRLKNIKKLTDKDNATNLPFSSMALDTCLNAVANGIGWSTKWKPSGTQAALPDGRLYGIGISGYVCNKGNWGGDVDEVHITSTTDVGFFIMCGLSSLQQEISSLTYVAAEAIGCNAADVHIGDYGNTATTQNCGAQGGSTRAITTGQTTMLAGYDMRSQLFQYAAPMLKTTPDKLSSALGKIYVTANPSSSVTIAAVLADSGTPPLVGRAYTTWDQTKQVRTTPAAAVEIAIDPNTGMIEVLNAYDTSDVGTAHSKLACEAQIDSGLALSIGHQLMWGWAIDPATGVPLNPSYLHQKPETILDIPVPSKMTSIVTESHDSTGPFGAKGLGGPPYGVIGPAIANAFFNATGKVLRTQPSTPRDVLKALGKTQ